MTGHTQNAVGLYPDAADEDEEARVPTDLCVVHLARRVNGLDTFKRFLDSYRRHPAGAPHALAVLLKGFRDTSTADAYRSLAADICDHWLEVPDEGFDLGAYRQAARALPYRTLVFLNSFSVIRADGWLGIMSSVAGASSVGAVGASGSWGSQASHARYELGLGGPYRRVFTDRRVTSRVFAGLTADTPGAPASTPTSRDALRRTLRAAGGLIAYAVASPGFPSPHLRSNCLLVDRDVWLSVCRSVPSDKRAAYRFESGRRGMTARLAEMGLRVLVAGRDGLAYETQQWPASRTFWQGNQENLLVEDNQTRAYQRGGEEIRRVLSGFAWGAQADPAEPLQGAA